MTRQSSVGVGFTAGGAQVYTAPANTDTLVGRASTDTLTNKTYDTAGTGNSLSINGLAATANTGTGAVVRATSPTMTGTVGLPIATLTGLITNYNSIATAGNGIPSIYGFGRSTAQTAAVASVATYTVGAADASFVVSTNVLVTTSTTHSFSVQVTYTDEGNVSRTVTFNVQQLAGTLITAITNVTGATPYEGVPLHIRCKASTAITILTSGTFTSVTYNVEGAITKIA